MKNKEWKKQRKTGEGNKQRKTDKRRVTEGKP
jgi:hypothetical protein